MRLCGFQGAVGSAFPIARLSVPATVVSPAIAGVLAAGNGLSNPVLPPYLLLIILVAFFAPGIGLFGPDLSVLIGSRRGNLGLNAWARACDLSLCSSELVLLRPCLAGVFNVGTHLLGRECRVLVLVGGQGFIRSVDALKLIVAQRGFRVRLLHGRPPLPHPCDCRRLHTREPGADPGQQRIQFPCPVEPKSVTYRLQNP